MEVAVVVLGDVGRSPRMQFHCLSLCGEDWVGGVTIVGSRGTRCLSSLEECDKFKEALLEPYGIVKGSALGRKMFLLMAPVKIGLQTLQLLWKLMLLPKLDCVVVQNPPCIPTFIVLLFVKQVRGVHVVVDWHNLGYTIMGLQLGEKHWLVRVAKVYERVFGWLLGDAHLCVTEALSKFLKNDFGLDPTLIQVQYDKPPNQFRRLEIEEQHELFEKLAPLFGGNLFTHISTVGKVENLATRPALIVSSTSWTPDEDFGILLGALELLDKKMNEDARHVICVVTGKGPQKAMYETKIAALELKRVTVKTAWLEMEDYPLLLGSADLGVCLHTSSSGLDLPMKIVDMFGSGLPVCAIEYECLLELVKPGENGMTFRTENELASQLNLLLLEQGFESRLSKLAAGAGRFSETRWSDHWKERTAPRIKKLGGSRRLTFFWVFLLLAFAMIVYKNLFV